eukprot:4109370-Pleurochrysis_carterae.AAC.1
MSPRTRLAQSARSRAPSILRVSRDLRARWPAPRRWRPAELPTTGKARGARAGCEAVRTAARRNGRERAAAVSCRSAAE